MACNRQGVTANIRPPIFRKKIENDKKNENFKKNFSSIIQGNPRVYKMDGMRGLILAVTHRSFMSDTVLPVVIPTM